MYYDQIKLLKQGVEKARGLLGDAIDVVPGLGTVNQGLLAAENIGRGNLAGAAENIQNLVPTGKIAGRAIKALTKGKGQSEVAGVLNIDAPKYQGSHRAPYKDDEGFNAPLSALDKLYPSDVYSPKAIQYYGAGQPGEREALRVAAQVRNNPSAKVRMYRAVPKDVDAADINPGDWVTLSKDYAKYHGDAVLGGDYKILSKEVPAGSLYTNADSLNEFGYDPTGFGIQGGLLDSNTDSSLLNRYQAPQDDALALAQKRAALPVSEGGLGLPPDNTPMDRARAAGLDTRIFHGVAKPELKRVYEDGVFVGSVQPEMPDLLKVTQGAGGGEGGALFGSDMAQIANTYAMPSKDRAGAVYPLLVRSQDFKKAGYNVPEPTNGKWDSWLAGLERYNRSLDRSKNRYFSQEISAAKDQGAGGVVFKNTEDAAFDTGNVPASDIYAINGALVRSPFAAFDPFRFGENDLLAIQGGLLGTSQDSSILNRYETDADRRMEIARRNAALPVEQGGLGLPENNTPMDRAGILFPKKGFHATGSDIRNIDPARVAESDYGTIGQGFYIDPSPNAGYSNLVARINQAKAPQNIMPVRYRDDNLFDMTGMLGPDSPSASKSLTERLSDMGYQGTMSSVDGLPNEVAVFDPKIVRSEFAAFDPFRRNEADLLALQGGQYTPQDLLGFERMMGLLGE